VSGTSGSRLGRHAAELRATPVGIAHGPWSASGIDPPNMALRPDAKFLSKCLRLFSRTPTARRPYLPNPVNPVNPVKKLPSLLRFGVCGSCAVCVKWIGV
jgi:hypothetical protein